MKYMSTTEREIAVRDAVLDRIESWRKFMIAHNRTIHPNNVYSLTHTLRNKSISELLGEDMDV